MSDELKDVKEVMNVAFIDKAEAFDIGVTSQYGEGVMVVFNGEEGDKNALIFRDSALEKLLTSCKILLTLYEGTSDASGEGDILQVPTKTKVTLH